MKTLNTLLLTMVLVTGSTIVNGQGTATATATATIVSPITITQNADLNFGNIMANGSLAGTVVLSTTGTRTSTGGATLPATVGTVNAAQFTVSGETGYFYSITLPADITLVHSLGLAIMMADNLVSDPATTGTLATGSQIINVGATLNVDAGQMQGFYSGSFDVTVNYN